MATPATGAAIGTPASISASDEPQTVAIEDEPFDSVISETRRTVYGNCSARRQHRLHRAPRQLAVADFAAASAAHAAGFTDAVGREVVVEHEALFGRAARARR